MLFLGIDGGSTKIDFAVENDQGVVVAQYSLKSCSNLKYAGSQAVIQNIQKGITQLVLQGVDLAQIVSVYAGIAECGEANTSPERAAVYIWFAQMFGPISTLADDQYSVFRSLSSTHYGVLANAGTGSNINLFATNTSQTHKSVGYGGRDFGKALLALCYNGVFASDHPVYQVITGHLGMDPVSYFEQLSGHDFVINTLITDLPRAIQAEYRTNSQVQAELRGLLITMGTRWGSKISAYCLSNFGFSLDDSFEIVLRGGLWSWSDMRTIAVQDILKTFPHATIAYDPSVLAVRGCTILAQEQHKKSRS